MINKFEVEPIVDIFGDTEEEDIEEKGIMINGKYFPAIAEVEKIPKKRYEEDVSLKGNK